MNELSPKISVIVPVYKAETYLHRCVDSLLAQTFQDYEILLIDDGSPDRSGEICDEYAKKDKRIRVFHKENGGVSSARNIGIKHAVGQWITFVDSDDWVEKEMFATILNYPYADEVDLIFYGFQLEGEEKYLKDLEMAELKYIFCNSDESIVEQCYNLENMHLFGWTCNKFFKKSIIQDNCLYFNMDIALQEDHLFTLKYTKCVSSLIIIPYYPYHYVLHSNSLMRKKHSTTMLEKISLLLLEDRLNLVRRDSNVKYIRYTYDTFLADYTSSLLNCSIAEYENKKNDVLYLRKVLKNEVYSKNNKRIICLYLLSFSSADLFVKLFRLLILIRQKWWH